MFVPDSSFGPNAETLPIALCARRARSAALVWSDTSLRFCGPVIAMISWAGSQNRPSAGRQPCEVHAETDQAAGQRLSHSRLRRNRHLGAGLRLSDQQSVAGSRPRRCPWTSTPLMSTEPNLSSNARHLRASASRVYSAISARATASSRSASACSMRFRASSKSIIRLRSCSTRRTRFTTPDNCLDKRSASRNRPLTSSSKLPASITLPPGHSAAPCGLPTIICLCRRREISKSAGGFFLWPHAELREVRDKRAIAPKTAIV